MARDILAEFVRQFAYAAKLAAADRVLGDEREVALNLDWPAGIGRRVMNVVARVACQPRLDLECL
jgi:hypothetical protein